MTKEYIGRAMAFCGKPAGMSKNKYVSIGMVFKNEDDERISIKIDSLPLPGAGWTGWVNVWLEDDDFAPRPKKKPTPDTDDDDGIPF